MLLDLLHDAFGFGSRADELLLLSGNLFLLLLLVRHLNIATGGSSSVFRLLLIASFAVKLSFVLLGPVLSLKLAALQQRLLELVRAELEQIEDLGEGDLSEDLRFAGFCTANIAGLLPVEPDEVDAEVFGLDSNIDVKTEFVVKAPKTKKDAARMQVYLPVC